MVYEKQKLIQATRNKLSEHYLDTGKTISFAVAGLKIGITKATMSRFLRGNPIDLDTFIKIITWLDLPANEFIN